LACTILFSYFSHAQQVGSKVSLTASDGKTYTGVISEVQGDKFKIKYDGFDFTAWLTSTQFTVTDATNEQGGNVPPAMPAQPNYPQADPQAMPQPTAEAVPQAMDNGGPKSMTKADSLKFAVNKIKDAFGALNKMLGAKRETMAIMISDIDYDNTNLSQLKGNLKNVKGVKSVQMNYKAPNAVLEVSFKGKATDVWDNLPVATRSAFKLLEMTDNSIMLKQKNF